MDADNDLISKDSLTLELEDQPVVAYWEFNPDGESDIFVTRFDPETQDFQSPQNVSNTPEASEYHPSLVVDRAGNFHLSYWGSGGEVFYASRGW